MEEYMKSLLASLIVIMSVAAHAEHGSEVLFVPKAGQSSLKAGYDMGSGSYKVASADVKVTQNVFGFEYMYGVDNEMAVGAGIGSGSLNVKSGSTTFVDGSGMTDLNLMLRMTSGMFVYGANLGLPLAKHTVDGTKENMSTGGMSVMPMGGFVMQNGAFNFGALAMYDYKMEAQTDTKVGSTTTTTKETPGSVFSLVPWGEWNFGSGFITAGYIINSVGDGKDSTGAATKETQYNTLKLGASYEFTPAITGLADYKMDMYQKNSTSGDPAYTLTTISLGARFVF